MKLRPDNPNLTKMLEAVAKLGPILDQIVFTGGCAAGLLLTDVAAAPIRPTIDVDAIIEVTSYEEFMLVERRMRDLGFRQPQAADSPICRWASGGLILDLMPTDPSILGFGNRWFGGALQHAQKIQIEDAEVRLITAPYFLATKLEAFHGRGKGDFRLSHDLEDIVTLLDGRPELGEEILASKNPLRSYLIDELRSLLRNEQFREALPGHLLPDEASQQRVALIFRRIHRIIED